MSIQLSQTVRHARLDAIETTIGTTPILELYSGAVPTNCAAADPSGLLCTINLPSDWLAASASGSKTINNSPWTGTGSAAGTAASFRIKDSTGTTCHMQGSVGLAGASPDMTVDNTSINDGQTVNVTAFTLADGNA